MNDAYPPSPAASNPAVTAFDQIETLGYRGVAIFGPDEQAAGDGAGKRPCSGVGWQDHAPETHRACLTSTFGRNVGILCAHGSDDTAIDVDCDYPEIAAVLETLPVLAWLPRRYGNRPRFLVPCKIKNVSDKGKVHDLTFRHADGREFTIQIIRVQYVAWGIHPKTRKPYEWVGDLPPSANLPCIDYSAFVCQAVEAMGRLGFTTKADDDRPSAFALLPGDLTDEEKRALIETGERIARGKAKRIDNGSDRRDTHVFAAASYWRALIDADIVTEEEARDVIDAHLAGASPHYESQVNQGLRKGNDTAFKELGARRAFVAAGLAAASGVKTAGQLIMQQLVEGTNKTKVLWIGDNYRTLLDASWAFAAASVDRVFASSVSSKLSAVGLVNGRATAENFLTADYVRELLQRTILILEPVMYVPANTGGGVAPEKVPQGVKRVETVVDGPRNKKIVKKAWTCEGVADAFNAKTVLMIDATGKTKHDRETTVWLPVAKLDSLTVKLAVDRIMATLDGVVLQEMLGVFQGPQMLPNGTIVAASGLYTARGTPGVAGQEVAFIDVGEVAGMLEAMPLDRAMAVLKGYVDLFPYAEPEDGAVLVALTVTGFCRLAFKLAPLILIDAAIFGAGKTFAAERLASLNGTAPSLIACTNKSRDSGDEMRKRIETVLLTGQAGFKILDDVPGGELPNVESFRTVLTANEGKCSIRILGESRSVEVSPAKHTWIATGNNVRVSEDMVRRSVHARLDRDKAAVWGWGGEKASEIALDRIRVEPKARAEIVSAILSLLQHVRQTGPSLPRLSNFEGWSVLPREVAYLVMGADPVATQARLRANDEKAIEHAEITTALLALIGTEAQADAPPWACGTAGGFMLAHDIVKRIGGISELANQVAPGQLPEYVLELQRRFDAKDPRELHNRLSAWLRQHRDRRTALDEDGVSYAVVSKRMRDPKQRKMRDHWGVKVHRGTAWPWL